MSGVWDRPFFFFDEMSKVNPSRCSFFNPFAMLSLLLSLVKRHFFTPKIFFLLLVSPVCVVVNCKSSFSVVADASLQPDSETSHHFLTKRSFSPGQQKIITQTLSHLFPFSPLELPDLNLIFFCFNAIFFLIFSQRRSDPKQRGIFHPLAVWWWSRSAGVFPDGISTRSLSSIKLFTGLFHSAVLFTQQLNSLLLVFIFIFCDRIARKKFTYNFPLDRVKLINDLRFFFVAGFARLFAFH